MIRIFAKIARFFAGNWMKAHPGRSGWTQLRPTQDQKSNSNSFQFKRDKQDNTRINSKVLAKNPQKMCVSVQISGEYCPLLNNVVIVY